MNRYIRYCLADAAIIELSPALPVSIYRDVGMFGWKGRAGVDRRR